MAMVFAVASTAGTSIPACAQAHERDFGNYTLRSSVIGSLFVEPAIAKQHSIKRAKNCAVLNVVVVRGPAAERASVPATVVASIKRRTREIVIPLREIRENESVSYLGQFEMTTGEIVELNISAKPRYSSRTLTMSYRDAMPAN